MELLLTGERIDADARQGDRPRRLGGRRTTSSLDEARRLADRLLQGAPLAQRAMKEVAVRSQHLPMLEAIRFGETMRKVAAATEDATKVHGRRPKAGGRSGAVGESGRREVAVDESAEPRDERRRRSVGARTPPQLEHLGGGLARCSWWRSARPR